MTITGDGGWHETMSWMTIRIGIIDIGRISCKIIVDIMDMCIYIFISVGVIRITRSKQMHEKGLHELQ